MSNSDAFAGLNEITTFPFPVYSSAGFEKQASFIAERCARAFDFMQNLFICEPDFYMQALTERDWASHTNQPTFGMPHFNRGLKRLTVAIEPGDYWRSFVEIIRTSSREDFEKLKSIYGPNKGEIDLTSFFDLLVIHALAHGFHHQGQCDFPRYWLMEFFCNVCLHAFIALIEPEQLPFLETFPRLMTKVDATNFKHRALDDFELLYMNMDHLNYG